MQYQIKGASHVSGANIDITIDAASEMAARDQAADMGIMVASCAQLPNDPQVVIQQPQHLQTHQTVTVNVPNAKTKTNGIGTAGFVFAILGWVTCGLLCPIGLFLSLIGVLFRPRGLAVAGVIISGLGVIPLVFVGLGLIGMSVAGQTPQRRSTGVPRGVGTVDVERAREMLTADAAKFGGGIPATEYAQRILDETLGAGVVRFELDDATQFTLVGAGADGELGTSDDVRRSYEYDDTIGEFIRVFDN